MTNHNAVNMTELAEGMKVVGSQARYPLDN